MRTGPKPPDQPRRHRTADGAHPNPPQRWIGVPDHEEEDLPSGKEIRAPARFCSNLACGPRSNGVAPRVPVTVNRPVIGGGGIDDRARVTPRAPAHVDHCLGHDFRRCRTGDLLALQQSLGEKGDVAAVGRPEGRVPHHRYRSAASGTGSPRLRIQSERLSCGLVTPKTSDWPSGRHGELWDRHRGRWAREHHTCRRVSTERDEITRRGRGTPNRPAARCQSDPDQHARSSNQRDAEPPPRCRSRRPRVGGTGGLTDAVEGTGEILRRFPAAFGIPAPDTRRRRGAARAALAAPAGHGWRLVLPDGPDDAGRRVALKRPDAG